MFICVQSLSKLCSLPSHSSYHSHFPPHFLSAVAVSPTPKPCLPPPTPARSCNSGQGPGDLLTWLQTGSLLYLPGVLQNCLGPTTQRTLG